MTRDKQNDIRYKIRTMCLTHSPVSLKTTVSEIQGKAVTTICLFYLGPVWFILSDLNNKDYRISIK